MSKSAGITLSPATKGAVVDENRQTSLKGVFACGNVLHVHDLVDLVSEESEIAGRAAAEYIKGKINETESAELICGENVGYTVPQKISVGAENIKIFFRVKNVIKNGRATLSANGREIVSVSKSLFTPGEMQYINLKSATAVNTGEKIMLRVIKDE